MHLIFFLQSVSSKSLQACDTCPWGIGLPYYKGTNCSIFSNYYASDDSLAHVVGVLSLSILEG